MALTYGQWREEAKLLGLDQKGEMLIGLRALENWPVFKQHFKDTRIFDFIEIIEKTLDD